MRPDEIAKVELAAGQLWRPDDGTADRRIIRIDHSPTGMLAAAPAVWFREGNAPARAQPVSSFLNWLRLPGAHLVAEPEPDPNALPVED